MPRQESGSQWKKLKHLWRIISCSCCHPPHPRPGSEGNPQTMCEKLDEKPIQPIDPHEKPIRLIDVNSTISSHKGNIVFKAAKDWDFHVISHTWSLLVRDLSEHIGKTISKVAVSKEGPDAYNEAFAEADFRHTPCFEHLQEFLILLALDGVKEIWFDALCINQVDEEEKSREIRNMGAYYSQSKGCYVLPHGVGKGYRLWGTTGLPRWFERAWTFQEFVLPQRLIFLVEDLDQRFIESVNRLVTVKLKNGLCRCFLGTPIGVTDTELWGSAVDYWWWSKFIETIGLKGEGGLSLNETVNREVGEHKLDKEKSSLTREKIPNRGDGMREDFHQHLEILSSNDLCTQCYSLPMVRKARTGKCGLSSQIYLVDREAYLGVFQADFYYMKPVGFPHKGVAENNAVTRLCELYMILSMKGSRHWRLWEVMAEVRNRDCSRKEDRVLSTLGLLPVKMSQLRTGKGLEEQFVEVAKNCNPEIVDELCGMDGKPCLTVGMSWVPDLNRNSVDNDHSYCKFYRFIPSQAEMEKQKQQFTSAAACSSIKLFGKKVVSGFVLPITAVPAAIKEETFTIFSRYNKIQLPTHFIAIPKRQINSHTNPLEGADHEPAASNSFLQVTSGEDSCFIPLFFNAKEISLTSVGPDILAGEEIQMPSNTITGAALILSFELPWLEGGGEIQVPIRITQDFPDLEHLAVSFQVWIVLLGDAEPGPRIGFEEKVKVLMVCLSKYTAALEGGKEEELHKLGVLYIKEGWEAWPDYLIHTFEASKRRECKIGGFGADLSQYVSLQYDINMEYAYETAVQ